MNLSIPTSLFRASLLFVFSLTACSGGGGGSGGDTTTQPTSDVGVAAAMAGTWTVTTEVISTDCPDEAVGDTAQRQLTLVVEADSTRVTIDDGEGPFDGAVSSAMLRASRTGTDTNLRIEFRLSGSLLTGQATVEYQGATPCTTTYSVRGQAEGDTRVTEGSIQSGLLRFDIANGTAVLNGVIGSGTPDLVRELIRDYAFDTIEFGICDGSDDDRANLEAARLVRGAGLNTHVPDTGDIASGGVDFFLAGVERTVAPMGKLYVHDWGGSGGTTGSSLPMDASEHDLYLDYYAEMGVPQGFYWFTLQAAPADGPLHLMTREELELFGCVTR